MPKELDPLDIEAGDELDGLVDREVVLVAGAPASGKSDGIVRLCQQLAETGHKMVVIDRDRGTAKAIKEICGGVKPDNMTYFLARNWDRVKDGVNYAFRTLSIGDWLVFDMVGGLWDLAQNEYSRQIYGEDLTQHLMVLRAAAQAEMEKKGVSTRSTTDTDKRSANSIVATQMAYSGMEGRTDWSVIKRIHNDAIENAILSGDFNVLGTTSITQIDDKELTKWPLFKVIGLRPEGEKHNIHRFDTIMFLSNEKEGYQWRTDLGGGIGKDRGRSLARGIDYTGTGYIASYLEHHNNLEVL